MIESQLLGVNSQIEQIYKEKKKLFKDMKELKGQIGPLMDSLLHIWKNLIKANLKKGKTKEE